MPQTLSPGTTGSATLTVSDAISAQTIGSGELAVLATPALSALVEEAAWKSVSAALEEGQTSVGVALTLEHLAPTPCGMQVTATTRLEEVDGRSLHFSWEATDERGLIGRGTHDRVIVDAARFQAKANSKLEG